MKNKSIASLSPRKLLLSVLVAAPLATIPSPLWALPADQAGLNPLVTLSSGVTATSVSANQIKIDSTASNSVVKWTNFGDATNAIGVNDRITFNLPSASSSILNMVTGGATTINGTLISNGNLYIQNPNGIAVGATGVITANSVGLSTVNETEYYFLANGTLSYVANQGTSVTGAITVDPAAKITAASGTGNVWVTGQNIELAGLVDAGAVSVNTQNNGSVVLAKGGTLTVGNNVALASSLTVKTTGTGTIAVGDAGNGNTVVYGSSASLQTNNAAISQGGTGSLQVGTGAADATLTTKSGTANTILAKVQVNGAKVLTVDASGAAIDITASAGKLAIGGNSTSTFRGATAAGDLTLNAITSTGAVTGDAIGGKILSGGNVTSSAGITLGADSGKDVTFAGKGTSLTITGHAASTLGNVSITGTDVLDLTALNAASLTVSAAKNVTQSGIQTITNGVSITSTGGNVTLTQNIATAGNVSISGKNISFTAGTIGTAASNVTFNATAGDLAIATLASASLTATATGNITQTGTITAPSATIDGAKITLTGANDFGTVTLKNGGSGVSVTDANALVIGKTTNVTGNATILAAGDVTFGAAAADAITFTKDLTVTTTGAGSDILDQTDNITVGGNASFTVDSTGVVTIDGYIAPTSSAGVSSGLNHSFGKVNISSANTDATIAEAQTLNLGTINLGTGDLNAYSLTGITNNGKITAANVTVGAGTATAPGDIALKYVGTPTVPDANAISGTISLIDNLHLLDKASSVTGIYLAKSLSVVNGTGTGTLAIAKNVYGDGTAADISFETTGANALTLGALATTGTVSLKSATGTINVTDAGNTFTNLNLVTGGQATVSSSGNLTVSGTTTGAANTVSITAGTNLTIGSYTSSNTAATTFTATAGAVTDSTTGIWMFGPVTFAGKSVSVTQSGHNFGPVSITTSGNGAAAVVEAGTLNLGTITTGSGALTATSTSGNIMQSGTITTTGGITVKAETGTVVLNGANSIGGSVGLTALGNSSLKNVVNTAMGNSTVSNGTLTIDLSGTADKNISQATGSKIYAYGATTFKTAGTGTITIDKSGNQFGGLTIQTAGGAATVKEQTTLNVVAADVGAGALALTSEGGDIIDNGTVAATGVTTLSAANITLDKADSNYGTVKLTATGDVKLVDGTGDITLDTSSVTGALDVTNSAGNIAQLGALTIGGNTTFTASAAASAITLNNTANRFGGLKFTVGTGGAVIDEVTSINLRAGTLATGPVTLNTAGDFLTSGTGGSSFTNNLTINATGTIKPAAGSLLVVGTLTVNSGSIIDLSPLSKSGDLNSKDPVHPGAGAYTGPGQ